MQAASRGENDLKNALTEQNMQGNFTGARRGISLDSERSTSNRGDRGQNQPKSTSDFFACNAARGEFLSKEASLSASHAVDNSEICIANYINKQHFNYEKAAFAVVNAVYRLSLRVTLYPVDLL